LQSLLSPKELATDAQTLKGKEPEEYDLMTAAMKTRRYRGRAGYEYGMRIFVHRGGDASAVAGRTDPAE
jgi:hypothetical protein